MSDALLPNTGGVQYPKHPGVSDEDHYLLLMHASGQIDLLSRPDGMDVIRRYKAAADACPDHGGNKPPVRIPEIGELPPNHLDSDERAKWLERQRTQAFLDDDPKPSTSRRKG